MKATTLDSEDISARVGLQTISWGPRIHDLAKFASTAAKIGYTGIEFAQAPHTLPEGSALKKILQESDLTLLGFAGGSLRSRVEYAAEAEPLYLYLDEWDLGAAQYAFDAGLTVAIHPHVYKDIDTVLAALKYLDDFPQARLILDTAHAFLVGDDLCQIITQHWSRILAVHLKDWTSKFGRSASRFARGFTALGRGELSQQVREVVQLLRERRFPGWIIVEQDSPEGDPSLCAASSRDWLRQIGV